MGNFIFLWFCNVCSAGIANVFLKGAWYPVLIPLAFALNSVSYFTLYLMYRTNAEMLIMQVLMSSSQIVFGTVAGLVVFREQVTAPKLVAVTLAFLAVTIMASETSSRQKNNATSTMLSNADPDSPIRRENVVA